MTKKLNQKGIAHLAVFLVLVVIVIIGFAGWKVYEANNDTNASKNNNGSTSKKDTAKKVTKVSAPTYKIPDGYVVYENKDLGFKFVYPKEYGKLTKSKADDPKDSFYESEEPKPEYASGTTGKISFLVVKPSNKSISTFKYGPDVKIQDGKLIVTSVNGQEETTNVVGKQLKNNDLMTGISSDSRTNNGLTVFSIKSGDEGSIYIKYLLLTNNNLIILNLPDYYDGTAICTDANCKANNPAKNNLMQEQILNSISSL